MTKELGLKIEGVGNDSGLVYQKVDILKVARVQNNFCLSGYQLNYQKIVNELSTASSKNVSLKATEGNVLPIFKSVMDHTTLIALRDEVNKLLEAIRLEKEGKIQKQ